MTIGEKIKHHRKLLGFTQTELGERLGVKKNAVSKWECGRVDDIPASKIKQMAELFSVPISYLVDDFASEGVITDNTYAAIIGERIKLQRELVGWTVDYLSNITSISTDRISRFEDALLLPTLPELIYLANAFCCDLDYLAGQVWEGYDTAVKNELDSSNLTDAELDAEHVSLLSELTPDEIPLIVAYIQGIIAARKKE